MRHYIRSQRVGDSYRNRQPRQLCGRLHSGYGLDTRKPAGSESERRREQPLLFVPRQQFHSRSHARRLSLSCYPQRARHGDCQSHHIDYLRRSTDRNSCAHRRCRIEPSAGCDRTSHRPRRETSGRSSQKRKQYRRRPSSATCRRPTETSSRQRHIDTPRNRPRRGRPSIRLGTRRHRATPHGRHEPGGTTFRRRENVPSPSRQERPHHEASSGYIATTHRAGKYPQWRNLQTGNIHCSHSQGRCAAKS